ncbi:NADH:ubiquinone oxidoreductase, 24 kDa subunit [Candidatus Magnetobacterium bavaricum]|uniref:NADH:ubiquinone oxidoreductase, 24 kDa subunit n=1 Tax=Candidatus Magnetobacterium bavaricum TaxID=29290 RepID=A0A0F3GQP8_9BACT|nr:NADH:ubiquinone oxidoreductase, 24 kDa subunit [Candidatus Magnetobacterium bavaricum]
MTMDNKNSDALRGRIEEIKGRYPTHQAAVLPSLYAAQEVYGRLSDEAMREVSAHTAVPAAEVRGVATFYAMYKNRPMGRHIIQLCTNISCMIAGSDDLVEALRQEYDLKPGSTTGDGRFSLVLMECIGACGTAPAMMIDSTAYDSLTKEKMLAILQEYR